MSVGIGLAERGLLPTSLMRLGIRRLLKNRIRELYRDSNEEGFLRTLKASPIAVAQREANQQHYEIPDTFFQLVLGRHLKYSGCYWPQDVSTLDQAERAALAQICERAEIMDNQDILELGCGWGSLSLYLAKRYPNARIVGVSNSRSQRAYISARAPNNLEVITADMNSFDTAKQFDRIVSIEMFEHMRNYQLLMERIAGWLTADGRLFVHVFSHRERSYVFETEGPDNWMGAHFFTGGLMPAANLLPTFDDHLRCCERWQLDGTHYQRTVAAWRENLETHKDQVLAIFAQTYGDDPVRWYNRWRIFFLSCEELFGYRHGAEWVVAHYLFAPAQSRTPDDAAALVRTR